MTKDRNSRIGALPAIALSIGMGALIACGHPSHVEIGATQQDQPHDNSVRYIKVEEEMVAETLDLAAKVQADPTKVIRIFPPASGRVVSIAVKPGDRVEQGQTLAVLSSSDVASARSDFAKAKVEAERSTRVMDREKLLFEHGAAAEKEYVDAQAQADSARAELARAQQRLDLLNVNPASETDRVSLIAPARGVILDVSAAPGEFSKSLESANPLITIADLDTVWIIGDVYEKDASKVSTGTAVTVTLQAYGSQKWTGRIDSVSGALDATTHTLKVRVALANPKQMLKPEMFGAMHVTVATRRAIVVPAAAIVREGNAATVFARGSRTQGRRPVTVGQAIDGKVEVLSGLSVGEEVAAEGAELLKNGPGQ